jgi:hypothetical protein
MPDFHHRYQYDPSWIDGHCQDTSTREDGQTQFVVMALCAIAERLERIAQTLDCIQQRPL